MKITDIQTFNIQSVIAINTLSDDYKINQDPKTYELILKIFGAELKNYDLTELSDLEKDSLALRLYCHVSSRKEMPKLTNDLLVIINDRCAYQIKEIQLLVEKSIKNAEKQLKDWDEYFPDPTSEDYIAPCFAETTVAIVFSHYSKVVEQKALAIVEAHFREKGL